MLIVTHEMQFAREIANPVIFMNGAPEDERTRSFPRRVTSNRRADTAHR
ncbi:MAG: hypothetical protein ACD_23C00054G0008 [uncultured bacterium]|nr:MAG: hypothetical protein ACD_23C00054G0008 [uncultured bacterium]